MSTHTPPLFRMAIVAGAALLLLSGCTPGTPTPTVSPTAEASATPTPTPTVEPISAPEPRIDLTCDALSAALPLAATFSTPVSSVSRAASEYGARPSMPEEYVIRSAGGLVCEFSNGQPQSTTTGSNPAYVGVQVLVLPDPGPQWDRYVSYYGVSGDRSLFCYSEATGANCNANALAGTTWVEASVVAAVNETAGTALVDAVLAAVGGAGPGAAVWSPPADTLALPDDCEAFVDAATLQSTTGLANLEPRGRDGGGWSLRAGAQTIDGSPSCFWAFQFADAGIGSLTVLRGGVWAAGEAQEIVGSAPITVAGLAEGDEARLRCGPADAWCVVDLVLGGNWVELYLSADDPGAPGAPLDRRTVIQSIAATVVANVTP